MTQPKRGLGRGLDALFGGPKAAAPTVEPPAPVEQHEAPPEASPPKESEPPRASVLAAELVIGAPAAPAPSIPDPAAAKRDPIAVEQRPAIEVRGPAADAFPHSAEVPRPPAEVLPAAPHPRVVTAAPVREPAAAPTWGPDLLDIDLIAPNPEQPRIHFEREQLRELSDSIREHGIIQPLIVSHDEAGGYRLIAGERRLQAARLAGLDVVPVVIREAADAELLELALIENIQRADLNAIEEAMAYKRLMEEYGQTQEDVARRVGKNRTTVANALRLLQLDPDIRKSLVSGEISEGHARALLGIPDARARVTAWRDVVKRKLSVRDTEGLVRRSLAGNEATSQSAGAQNARRDAAYTDVEGRLRRALSTRVTIAPQKKGARIVIECYSSEEFDNVVTMLLGDDA